MRRRSAAPASHRRTRRGFPGLLTSGSSCKASWIQVRVLPRHGFMTAGLGIDSPATMTPDRAIALRALLAFYQEVGVDAPLGEQPINRLAEMETPPALPSQSARSEAAATAAVPEPPPRSDPVRPAAAAPQAPPNPDAAVMA